MWAGGRLLVKALPPSLTACRVGENRLLRAVLTSTFMWHVHTGRVLMKTKTDTLAFNAIRLWVSHHTILFHPHVHEQLESHLHPHLRSQHGNHQHRSLTEPHRAAAPTGRNRLLSSSSQQGEGASPKPLQKGFAHRGGDPVPAFTSPEPSTPVTFITKAAS